MCIPPTIATQWPGKRVLGAMNTRNSNMIVGSVVFYVALAT
jgi:hypothetical protein